VTAGRRGLGRFGRRGAPRWRFRLIFLRPDGRKDGTSNLCERDHEIHLFHTVRPWTQPRSQLGRIHQVASGL